MRREGRSGLCIRSTGHAAGGGGGGCGFVRHRWNLCADRAMHEECEMRSSAAVCPILIGPLGIGAL